VWTEEYFIPPKEWLGSIEVVATPDGDTDVDNFTFDPIPIEIKSLCRLSKFKKPRPFNFYDFTAMKPLADDLVHSFIYLAMVDQKAKETTQEFAVRLNDTYSESKGNFDGT